ncbi:MAG: HD-GYP domain-containing protein [Phycisphaerales bacterium]
MSTKPSIEITFRPRTRRAFMTGVLIAQSALLLGSVLLTDTWVQTHLNMPQLQVDRLFVLELSIALSVVTLTAMVFYLASKRYNDELEEHNQKLEEEVGRQVNNSLTKRNALIHGLAKLADHRDTDTGDHLDRIGLFARVIAEHIKPNHPDITDEWIDRLVLASSLHDIGKVGVPDAILLKPGRLTPEERTIMEKHTLIGGDTLLSIREKFGADEFIDMGAEIALQHHEKWDGSGYPFHLDGTNISIAARIVAIADVYDALTSVRVYKDAMTHQQAAKIILEGKGSHFDPELVEAFEANEIQFQQIRAEADHTSLHPIHRIDLEDKVRNLDNKQVKDAA